MDIPSTFIHSLFVGNFDWPHFGVIMNNVAMSLYLQGFVWTDVFISHRQILKSGMSGSCGKCMFNILGNLKMFSKFAVPLYLPINTT